MPERKTFGVLQQPSQQAKLSFQGGKIKLDTPMGRKRKNDENESPLNFGDSSVKSTRRDGIFEDSPTPVCKRTKLSNDIAVQTSPLTLRGAHVPSVPKSPTNAASGSTDISTQTSAAREQSGTKKQETKANEILDMLTSEKPSERYWEMVATERKVALKDALQENRTLHARNTELQEEVHRLTEDNTLMEVMLEEAKQMAELLESVTSASDAAEGREEITQDSEEVKEAKDHEEL